MVRAAKNIATWLLLISLATIAWTWSAGQMVLRNADLQEFMVELVRLVIFVGFFLALILNADTWSTALINGFMWTGNQVAGTGITGDINTAAILELGFIVPNILAYF
ncbi:type IV secretion system protein [Marinomonas sp. 2405UD68-3]|uniref:type IV secretion system protein n=1 Tax=Marinomonas sp. 2405UD68-3 TaxID=3391835 RepID=UPI0039C975AA